MMSAKEWREVRAVEEAQRDARLLRGPQCSWKDYLALFDALLSRFL